MKSPHLSSPITLLLLFTLTTSFSTTTASIPLRGITPDPPSNARSAVVTSAETVRSLGVVARMEDHPGATADIHFDGTDGDETTPPDPQMAVGKKKMILVVNGEISLHAGPPYYNRLEFSRLHEFFDEGLSPIVYDPRTVYNHYSDRFLVIASQGASTDAGESALLLALSRTDEPTSLDPEDNQWIISSIDTDVEVPANSFGYTLWSDYPTLGYDEFNAYVGFNMFLTASSSGPLHSKLYAIKWDDIQAANSQKIEWLRLQDNDAGDTDDLTFTPQPAVRYHAPGDTTGDHYTLSHSSLDGDLFIVYRTKNPAASTPVTHGSGDNPPESREPEVINIALPVAGCGGIFYTSPSFVDGDQGGTDIDIDLGDSRLMDAIHRDDLGLLYTVVTTQLVSGHTGVMVVGFNTTGENTTCHEVHVIEDASSADPDENWYFAFPAITMTANGDIAVAFSGTRELSFASVFTAYKVNGTWSGPLMVQEGLGPYTRLASPASSRTRWGDYSQMVLDPSNPDRVWGFVQYAGQDPGAPEGLWTDQTWHTRAFSYDLSSAVIGGCDECDSNSPCFLTQCVCDLGLQEEGYDCPNICPDQCFEDEGRGTCDYLTETCSCKFTWTGESCDEFGLEFLAGLEFSIAFMTVSCLAFLVGCVANNSTSADDKSQSGTSKGPAVWTGCSMVLCAGAVCCTGCIPGIAGWYWGRAYKNARALGLCCMGFSVLVFAVGGGLLSTLLLDQDNFGRYFGIFLLVIGGSSGVCGIGCGMIAGAQYRDDQRPRIPFTHHGYHAPYSMSSPTPPPPHQALGGAGGDEMALEKASAPPAMGDESSPPAYDHVPDGEKPDGAEIEEKVAEF